MNFEYKEISIMVGEFESTLNKFGKEGWELVSFDSSISTIINDDKKIINIEGIAYLKREIPSEKQLLNG